MTRGFARANTRNMNQFLIAALVFVVTPLFAQADGLSTVRVLDPRGLDSTLLSVNEPVLPGDNALSVSLRALDQSKIAYRVAGSFLASIADYEPSIDNMDGWCFSVDGLVPGMMADAVELEGRAEPVIEWFWGHPERLASGDWTCVRSVYRNE